MSTNYYFIPNLHYLENIFNFSVIDITFSDDYIFEYGLSRVNCAIILISTAQSCSFTLIPKQSVDIQLKFTIYNSDFIIVAKTLELSKDNPSSFGNYSEPKVPRLMSKKVLHDEYGSYLGNRKDLMQNINISFENLIEQTAEWILSKSTKNERSGIYIARDVSLNFTTHTFQSKSRFELLIQTPDENAKHQFDVRRFAVNLHCRLHGNLYFYYKSDNTTFVLPSAGSAILLKSKTKLLDPKISLDISFDIYVKWPWHTVTHIGGDKLSLEYSFPFYQLKYGKYFSLSGNQEYIHIKSIQFQDIPRTEPLTVMWIRDNYVRQRILSEIQSEKCVIKGKTLLCKKIELLTNVFSREYYLITQRLPIHHYKLKSWEEAANTCQLVGGYLPWFQSRDNLHELLSLFKLSKHFPTTEAIYIGLKYNSTEVSKNFFFICPLQINYLGKVICILICK